MDTYDDLMSRKGSGTPFDRLTPLEDAKLAELRGLFGSLPSDYVSFLHDVGYGEMGRAGYMLYGGLVDPDEIYGEPQEHLKGILLFGDDFQGVNAGFETSTWKVVEIDPINRQIHTVAPSFEAFLRQRIAELS